MVKKRVRQLKIDPKKLAGEVQKGLTASEIMDKYGLKSASQVRNLYYRGLVEKGVIPDVKSGRAKKKPREVVVGKRGSLILPRDVIEGMGFDVGDRFDIRKWKLRLILRKTS